MKIRFQADADFNQAIVTGVLRRQPSIDFKSANASKLENLNDLEVLAIAAKEGRILVSHDRKTMPRYFGEFIATQSSSGLLIISQKLAIGRAIESLILIWETFDSEDWVNQIASLPL